MKLPLLSLYIHIPWCVRKCPYCDFNSYTSNEDIPHQKYVHHLLADLENHLEAVGNRTIKTIFIGGGTPSLFSSKAMQILLDGVRSRIDITDNAEITIEANPSTIEANRFSEYQHAGINRISIGVQSFNNNKLIQLGRIHNAEEAKRSVHLATNLSLQSFNLDLMHGLPNQSLEEALDDLHQLISFNPPHLSWYQLTIEPNTLFSSRPPVLPDDEILWDIFNRGHQLLIASGYKQYEISSYTRLGFQCQHNLNYWRFGDYLGIGCGAHSKLTFIDNRILRIEKTKNPRAFMQGRYRDKQYEVMLEDRPFEFFMNRFRLLEEAPRADFINYTGLEEITIRYKLDKALVQGYIKETPTSWQITEKGKLFLNNLLEFFLFNKN